MKYLSRICLYFIISISSLTLRAETITWKGGTPGDETNWVNPKNWEENIVPTEISGVVIPNTSTRGNFYPVIDCQVNAIGSLLISGGAELSISSLGLLIVNGAEVFNYGVMNLGSITVEGEVIIKDCALEPYIGDDTRHACYVANKPKTCNQFQLVNIQSEDSNRYLATGGRVYGDN